jgi:tRNA (guanine10-N2)-dimethyltransferase
LSISEINSVLITNEINYEVIYQKNNVLIVSSSYPELLEIDINALGGTIKLFSVLNFEVNKSSILDFVRENFRTQEEGRIIFGISGYGSFPKNFIFQLGIDIKEYLVNAGHKVRFVTGKHLDLSSVIVNENKMIERGFEIILIPKMESFIVGKTISVQNYKLYSKRDFGRPKRNDRNGMMPPKLAQIMINLSETSKKETIYDPFCGSGTVLQEAFFLGYKNLFGSDINPKIIADSEENLRWFVQSFRTENFPIENLFISDILTPSKDIKADGIICEGYLGEPSRRSKEKAIQDTKKLAEFYLKALKNLKFMLSKNGRVVIAIPFFIVGKEYFYLPILDKLNELGFRIIKPLPENIKIFLPGRGNLTYARPDQFVGREILILEHKK